MCADLLEHDEISSATAYRKGNERYKGRERRSPITTMELGGIWAPCVGSLGKTFRQQFQILTGGKCRYAEPQEVKQNSIKIVILIKNDCDMI